MKKNKLLALILALVMVLPFALTACQPTEPTPPTPSAKTYTYRAAAASITTNWNTHTYQSNDATDVLGYTEDGLYTFDYNEDKDGYVIIPSMATEMPIDVSEDYAEKFGYDATEEGRAYKIPLRNDLKFQNGDAINAQTFVDSIKLLLNPAAANKRASDTWTGNMKIFGAEDYNKSGLTKDEITSTQYETIQAAWDAGKTVYITKDAISSAFSSWFGGTYEQVKNAGYFAMYFSLYENGEKTDVTFFDKYDIDKAEDGKIEVTQAILDDYAKCSDWNPDPQAEVAAFSVVSVTYPEYAWEDVGVFADPADPLALIIVLEQPLTGFYLNYSLSGSLWLVHPATYESCTKMTGGVYSNDYATSKDKYVGFGPYQIDTYTADHSVTFKKNNNWWGFTSGEQSEFYQTTNISIVKVTEESTRLEMFLKGELDSYGLTVEDMEDYQGSDYTYYTEGDSTWFVAMNPDPATLAANEKNAVAEAPTGAEIDKQILTIKEFRQALSFSLDRAAYALELDPLGAPAKALYGNMIISDPETGTAYRTTEEAKDTILAFWGLTDHVGPGKDYATKDEAIASITGYDPSGAKALFTQAYEKAVELGYISAAAAESGNFCISIIIGRPAEAAYYDNGYQFLSATWTKAVEGTPLEGKLLFTQSAVLGSSAFADRLRDGTVDLLFGVGWTGSALDPYGLMQAYVDPGYQYDPSWDTSTATLDIALDLDGKGEKTYRASVYGWGYQALSGVEIKEGVYGVEATVLDAEGQPTEEKVVINAGVTADATLRLKILAAVEKAVLEQYNMIPVNSDSSASLKGMRIVFGTEEYIYGVGRGGVKYMTYTADDAAWAQYVKDQGGTLNYK